MAAIAHPVDISPVEATSGDFRASRDPLGAVRRPPDPFSLGDMCTDGTCASEASYAIAQSLVVQVGGAERLDEHLWSLAVAPAYDLRAFKRARGTIFFADTFLAAASSMEAGFRRGGPLDRQARARYAELDRDSGRVFGVYDPAMHALIFTPQATPPNHEHVTLHELGHGLTLNAAYRTAHLRPDLLQGLPRQIRHMLAAYPQGNEREAVRERVLEVLAEAYVWTVVGRWRELPPGLFATLQAILTADC